MAWNRPNDETKAETVRGRASRGRSLIRGVVGGGVVVLGAGIAAWFCRGSSTKVQPDASVTPRKAIQIESAAQKAASKVPAGKGDGVKLPVKPLTNGVRIEKRDTLPQPESLGDLEAAVTNRSRRPKAAFANATEQLLALAMPSSPGAAVPPLPDLSHSNIDKAAERELRHVISAEEGDSEALLKAKADVVAAKEDFRQLREAEGLTFSEYVNALRNQANLDAEFLADAQRVTDELYHDQGVSDDDYIKYRDQVNEKLRERGLPEIGVENEDKENENE